LSSETLARPYARAIFEHSEGLLEELGQVVNVIHQPNVTTLIDSPKLAYKEKAEIFIDLFQEEIQKKTAHFLRVLGNAKRLSLLPEILQEYKKLLAKKNKQNDVLITSAFKLNQSQEEEITGRLKKRYGENLTAKVEIDKTLIGGITIKSGDEVIDLSTKGKLLKLKKQIS
jgi:F-type H+-transporting ATPase subunit delta